MKSYIKNIWRKEMFFRDDAEFKLPDYRALILIVITVLIFFVSKWVLQGAWFPPDLQDISAITSPIENIYAQIQRSGESPLWASELAGGYPLLAIGQLGYWYLPHMVLRQFFDGALTLNLSMLIHSLLLAIGVFVFLRSNKVGLGASILGALALPLGGAFVGKFILISILLPFAWVPVIFYFLQRFLEIGRLRNLFLWIICNAFAVLAGHPQMAVQVFLFEAIFVICLISFDWKRLKRVPFLIIGGTLFIGIALPQLLPVLNVVPFTDRANGVSSIKELFEFNYPMQAFKGIIFAHPFGHGATYHGPKNEAELSSYLGPVIIILSLVGLFGGWKRFRFLWLFSCVSTSIGILLALGGDTFIYRWLVDVGWRYFNIPARFLLFADFGLVFLASIGFQLIVSNIRHKTIRYCIGIILVGTALIPLMWVSWSWYEGVPWVYTKEPAVANILNKGGNFVRVYSSGRLSDTAPNNDFGIMVWNQICSSCIYRQTFTSPYNVIRGINLKLSRSYINGTITMKLFDNTGQEVRQTSISSSNVVDSQWNTFSFEPIGNILNKSFYFEVTSDIPKMQASRLLIHTNPDNEQYDPSGSLFSCVNDVCNEIDAGGNSTDMAFGLLTTQSKALPAYEILTPNVPSAFGVGSAQWAGSLGILNVSSFLKPIGEGSGASAWQNNRSIINRFPITHAIGLYPPYRYATNLTDFTEVTSIPLDDMFIRLYKNNEAFPRVQFVEHVEAVSGSEGQLKALPALNSTDEQTVVSDIPKDAEFLSGGIINNIKDERSRVIISTTNASQGFLVMRDVLLSGWTATVDGQATSIYLTDSLFRGIVVPAGNHTVVFQYSPSWIRLAGMLTTVALLITGVLGWFSWNARRQ